VIEFGFYRHQVDGSIPQGDFMTIEWLATVKSAENLLAGAKFLYDGVPGTARRGVRARL
jgi:hypothetical protein